MTMLNGFLLTMVAALAFIIIIFMIVNAGVSRVHNAQNQALEQRIIILEERITLECQ